MDTYSLLREIADSWILLAMFIFFIGVIFWAYWPSQAGERRAASQLPFRYDEPVARPADHQAREAKHVE